MRVQSRFKGAQGSFQIDAAAVIYKDSIKLEKTKVSVRGTPLF